jgi:hypothetical protein
MGPAAIAVGTKALSVTLETSGIQFITATDTANASITGTQSSIQVNPAGLNHLAITPTSSTISAGGSQAYLVVGVDGFGNVIGVEPATLTISPNGSCTGTSCTATVAGSHTVTATYSGRSVKATLNVTAAAASVLVFGQQPTNTHRNSVISPPVTVQILDAYGNLVTTSTASVTISLAANPGNSTLSGTTTKSASRGIAAFNNLSLNNTRTGYRLGAASGGLGSATSSTFQITS